MESIITEKLLNDDLRTLISLIKKCKNSNRKFELYNDFNIYNELLEKLGFSYYDEDRCFYLANGLEFSKFIRQYRKSHLKNYEFDMEICENFQELEEFTNFYEINDFRFKNNFSIQETLEYNLEFFDKFNPLVSSFIKKMSNSGRIILAGEDDELVDFDISGFTVCGSILDSQYVVIRNENNIMDTVTLAHEMGHVYFFDKTKGIGIKKRTKSLINDSYEVTSLFTELLMYDFLLDKYNMKRDVEHLQKLYDQSLVFFNEEISDIVENSSFLNYYELYYEYQKNYSYARGFLLAYYFYDMYKNDPEKCMRNLDSFISDSCIYDFNTLINRNGLDRERIESLDVPKKYIKTHYDIKNN